MNNVSTISAILTQAFLAKEQFWNKLGYQTASIFSWETDLTGIFFCKS